MDQPRAWCWLLTLGIVLTLTLPKLLAAFGGAAVAPANEDAHVTAEPSNAHRVMLPMIAAPKREQPGGSGEVPVNLLRVSVSPNGRFLQRADGSPFFWTADTAWHLLHRSTREEAEQYLQHRRANGFNVIQTVILAERPLSEPNAYGCRSLVGNDPGQPNECYFEHVDWVVQRAGELGLYVALLPTWGDKVNLAWGSGPVIFNSSNAYTYGAFLGARYREASNVLWVLGGDRDVANDTQREIWLKLAQGIVDGVGGDPDQVLIGYHPQGWKRSSTWFQPYPIVKLHAMQSGHASRDIPVWDWIQADYQLTPPGRCLILSRTTRISRSALSRRTACSPTMTCAGSSIGLCSRARAASLMGTTRSGNGIGRERAAGLIRFTPGRSRLRGQAACRCATCTS